MISTEFVVNILKVGLPGLVFLLSFLSYNLLNKEQSKETPRAIMLKYIEHFMYVSIVLAILTASAPLIEYQLGKKEKIDSFQATAQISAKDLKQKEAAVCSDADYAGRYLLLEHASTNMIQVLGNGVLPCRDDKHKILIGPDDAMDMGLAPESAIPIEVSVAGKGQKFLEIINK